MEENGTYPKTVARLENAIIFGGGKQLTNIENMEDF